MKTVLRYQTLTIESWLVWRDRRNSDSLEPGEVEPQEAEEAKQRHIVPVHHHINPDNHHHIDPNAIPMHAIQDKDGIV